MRQDGEKKPLQLYSMHQTLQHFNMTFKRRTVNAWIQMLWSERYWLFVILTGFINVQTLDSCGTFIPKQPIYPASNIKHRSLHEGEAFHWTASLTIIAHDKKRWKCNSLQKHIRETCKLCLHDIDWLRREYFYLWFIQNKIIWGGWGGEWSSVTSLPDSRSQNALWPTDMSAMNYRLSV